MEKFLRRSQYLSKCRDGLAARLRVLERGVQQEAATTEQGGTKGGQGGNSALRLLSELTSLQRKMERAALFAESSGLCPACFIDRELEVPLRPGISPESLQCRRCDSTFSD